MLARIDHWIGKTLFVPLVIKLCHLTHQSQYAIARVFWFAAMLSGLYRADSLFDYVIFGAGSLIMMLTASLRADQPRTSTMWFRLFAMVGFVMKLANAVATGNFSGVEFWVFVLIAEYAATIRTLPPQELKERKRRKAEAERPTTSHSFIISVRGS